MTTPSAPPASAIKRSLRRLAPPKSLFSGVLVQQGFTPDNILCFKRTDTAALRPECVSNNYHHRFELVTVLEKAGPGRIDHATHELHPGECALIFPNQFHHFMDVARGKMEWLFITFELAHSEPIESLRNSPRILTPRALGHLERALEAYVHGSEPHRGGLELSYELACLLRELSNAPLIPKARRDIHSSDDVRDVILEGINTYVRAHLRKAVTIQHLADELGYSVSHLRAVFRDRLGVSLGRYIRESRLSQAAQLLQGPDLNVSEVGEACGFDSLFAFSRAFRKAYGVPPRTYRTLVATGAPLPQPSIAL